MTVRSATAADLPCLIELERRCATAAHWTEQQYQTALLGDGTGRIALIIDCDREAQQHAEPPPGILAFLIARPVGLEWELENIVVQPSARRKGLGATLLAELLAAAREAKSESVFLEVRESNVVARAFYKKLGFAEIGRRRGYYFNPYEDAILCRLGLS